VDEPFLLCILSVSYVLGQDFSLPSGFLTGCFWGDKKIMKWRGTTVAAKTIWSHLTSDQKCV
jgi:hypothetical protein